MDEKRCESRGLAECHESVAGDWDKAISVEGVRVLLDFGESAAVFEARDAVVDSIRGVESFRVEKRLEFADRGAALVSNVQMSGVLSGLTLRI